MTILAVTGVLREVRIAERAPQVRAIPGGGDAAALEARLRAVLLPAGGGEGDRAMRGGGAIGGIISFGLAGALAPHLRVGDWVVATTVSGGFERPTDSAWTAALLAKLTAVRTGPVFADGSLAATPQAKAEIHARTGAIAIDMESHVAAKVAAAHNLPFAILRVVSDSAADALPPAFAVAMRPDGGTDVPALLLSLATNPAQLASFIRAARNATAALRRLSLGCHLLGAGLGLGFADLGERA